MSDEEEVLFGFVDDDDESMEVPLVALLLGDDDAI